MCGLEFYANVIIEPFFIEVNLNVEKYVDMLNIEIIPAIREIVGHVWFLQRWIGQRGAIEWPDPSTSFFGDS